jgi:hypothetical protein
MTALLNAPTTTGPVVRGILIVTMGEAEPRTLRTFHAGFQ